MTQKEIDRVVALKTGESLRTIQRRGFSVISPSGMLDPDEEMPQPQIVDWDKLEAVAGSRAV